MRRPGGDTEPLVHGMGTSLVAPDWPPIDPSEAAEVLAAYGWSGAVQLTWRSPRPMSAAALVQRGREAYFVKRHHAAVRSSADLVAEHDFARHLAEHGVTVPAVCQMANGASVFAHGPWRYEVHERAPGEDRYRDDPSWSPFHTPADATAAGGALGALHLAAADYPAAERALGPLMSSVAIIDAPDPLAAAHEWFARRPTVTAAIAPRPLLAELERLAAPFLAQLAPLRQGLERHWGHGDWHPSNLMWAKSPDHSVVAAVIDFGLCNRTFAAHDVAVAIERSAIDWLGMRPDRTLVDRRGALALLEGYRQRARPGAGFGHLVAAFLPLCHLEYALSEIEYFTSVIDSPGNATLAAEQFLLGHLRWFREPAGAQLLEALDAAG
ncbi:MAG: phosphotransferase [Actinomycetota bacterium]|nr:phosphotransferase [Actinomycetota bacterium]